MTDSIKVRNVYRGSSYRWSLRTFVGDIDLTEKQIEDDFMDNDLIVEDYDDDDGCDDDGRPIILHRTYYTIIPTPEQEQKYCFDMMVKGYHEIKEKNAKLCAENQKIRDSLTVEAKSMYKTFVQSVALKIMKKFLPPIPKEKRKYCSKYDAFRERLVNELLHALFQEFWFAPYITDEEAAKMATESMKPERIDVILKNRRGGIKWKK